MGLDDGRVGILQPLRILRQARERPSEEDEVEPEAAEAHVHLAQGTASPRNPLHFDGIEGRRNRVSSVTGV